MVDARALKHALIYGGATFVGITMLVMMYGIYAHLTLAARFERIEALLNAVVGGGGLHPTLECHGEEIIGSCDPVRPCANIGPLLVCADEIEAGSWVLHVDETTGNTTGAGSILWDDFTIFIGENVEIFGDKSIFRDVGGENGTSDDYHLFPVFFEDLMTIGRSDTSPNDTVVFNSTFTEWETIFTKALHTVESLIINNRTTFYDDGTDCILQVADGGRFLSDALIAAPAGIDVGQLVAQHLSFVHNDSVLTFDDAMGKIVGARAIWGVETIKPPAGVPLTIDGDFTSTGAYQGPLNVNGTIGADRVEADTVYVVNLAFGPNGTISNITLQFTAGTVENMMNFNQTTNLITFMSDVLFEAGKTAVFESPPSFSQGFVVPGGNTVFDGQTQFHGFTDIIGVTRLSTGESDFGCNSPLFAPSLTNSPKQSYDLCVGACPQFFKFCTAYIKEIALETRLIMSGGESTEFKIGDDNSEEHGVETIFFGSENRIVLDVPDILMKGADPGYDQWSDLVTRIQILEI